MLGEHTLATPYKYSKIISVDMYLQACMSLHHQETWW